jgi:hypothetical protein
VQKFEEALARIMKGGMLDGNIIPVENEMKVKFTKNWCVMEREECRR